MALSTIVDMSYGGFGRIGMGNDVWNLGHEGINDLDNIEC